MSTPKTFIQVPGGTYDASTIDYPSNRDFREAWQLEGDAIVVDPVKAGKIQAMRDIGDLETMPRKVRERMSAMGDQYSIDEEAAIVVERAKL